MAKIRLERINFKTRREAETVFNEMSDLLNKYGNITVADYYELCGGTPQYTDRQYGWTSLKDTQILLSLDFGYLILLPEPIKLEDTKVSVRVEPVIPKEPTLIVSESYFLSFDLSDEDEATLMIVGKDGKKLNVMKQFNGMEAKALYKLLTNKTIEGR